MKTPAFFPTGSPPNALLLVCLFATQNLSLMRAASPEAVALKVAPGFAAEQIFAAGEADGSWSAMAIDPRGRIIISPQGSEPMLRVTCPEEGGPPRVEKMTAPVTSAMGLLFAFDSFYVNGQGPDGFGLYRLRDMKQADAFDEVKLLRKFEGEVSKEHGSHGLVAGPDQRIYLAQGNHVSPPADALASSPYANYAEDQLLPSASYGLSSGDRSQAPGGHVLRMDADGRNVEVFAGGFRNIYDLAFDAAGELFAFDSDTEFNWGQPWYVPTRILHVVGGGEYGFREGTGKWPTSYADSLPPVVEIGLGSPTGVRFGTASRFPERYRRALFALDWTFGRIVAVHLEASGASFLGKTETFLQGRPLNLTDLEFGRDGAMYFITGGRKTRSALHRVRYTGGEEQAGATRDASVSVERAERHALEALQGKTDAGALDRVWLGLDSEDRFIRGASRVALESQPAMQWSARALAEKTPRAALTALLALARVGSQADRAAVVAAVAKWWPQSPSESLQLDALRVAELALSRSGQPYPGTKDELLQVLDPAYPAKSFVLDRELSELLIALKAPQVVSRTLSLLGSAPTFEEQLHYVFHLRHVQAEWSAEERETYFRWFAQPHSVEAHSPEMRHWFADVRLHYADGGSLATYLTRIRDEAAATLSDVERQKLAPILAAPILPPANPVTVKPRGFVKQWNSAELLPVVAKFSPSRSVESGREVFTAAACIACHRYANEGGAIGPDLTTVAYKLSAQAMLESIVEPSKVISDQFQNTTIELANGEIRTGRILKKGKDAVTFSISATAGDREDIPRSGIRSMKPSPVSPMPEGLLNMLTEEEILDLFAYLGFGEH